MTVHNPFAGGVDRKRRTPFPSVVECDIQSSILSKTCAIFYYPFLLSTCQKTPKSVQNQTQFAANKKPLLRLVIFLILMDLYDI
jgi:hypothetical protein